jgi:hypothetical protein
VPHHLPKFHCSSFSESDLECGSLLPPLVSEARFAVDQGIRLKRGSKLPRLEFLHFPQPY